MKRIISFGFLALIAGSTFAQIDATEKDLGAKAKGADDSTKTWSTGGVINVGFGQTSLHNWAAGGLNSYSINTLFNVFANYSKGKLAWDNSLQLEYGTIKQFSQGQADSVKWFKNSDRVELNSKVGYEAGGHWYYTTLLNFRSQMAPGYDKTGKERQVISDLASPAYTTFAIGMDYKPSKNFNVFISPAAYRMLMVQRFNLRQNYGFTKDEADKGSIKSEFGAYLKAKYIKNEPFGLKNVGFQTDLALFSNYFHNPLNIDVYWNTLISLKVNKYITTTISINTIYDDDIKIHTTEQRKNPNGTPMVDSNNEPVYKIGPRFQVKEALSVGFSYKF